MLTATLVLTLPMAALAEEANGSAANASKKTFQQLNPWTDCGIGAMIFSETPVAAVSSNVIWDLGTTAVTSATSSANTCSGKNATSAMFIQNSYASLEEETVQGGGKHVDAMLTILGCNAAAKADITAAVRADFAQSLQRASYADESVTSKAQAYYRIVDQQVSNRYAQQCSAI